MAPRSRLTRLLAALGASLALTGAALVDATPAHASDGWFAEFGGTSVAVNGTYIPIVGDFAGPGTFDDIIWYAPGAGTDYLWTSNGDGTFTKAPLARQINGTYTPIVGQFGKDDYDDLFLYAPGTAADHLWLFVGGSPVDVAKTVNGTFTPTVLHDHVLTGGTLDKIVWYAPSTGSASTWRFSGVNGAHASVANTAPTNAKPLAGDFDGNGLTDVFWYRSGTPNEQLWRATSANATYGKTTFSVTGAYTPVVQDFTPHSDGRADIAWYHDGSSVLKVWSGKADGTFSSLTWATNARGKAIGLKDSWGYLWGYDPAGTDRIWYLNDAPAAPSDFATGNTEVGTGYTPLVGHFTASDGIFWYKAGSAPERLYAFATVAT